MTSPPRSVHSVVIALLLFLAALFWSWTQLDDRPVNNKGLHSDWLSLETWLTPLGNHQALGQEGVNLDVLYDVNFIDGQHGWAAGENGVILATSNGGQSWASQSSGVYSWLNSVWFNDVAHGWAAGDKGVILATSNGGNTWQEISSHLKLFGQNRPKLAVYPSPLALLTLLLATVLLFSRAYRYWALPRSLQGGWNR